MEVLGEGNGGYLTQSGGGVAVDQVGVRWICTIVNSAVVIRFKCALYKYICCVGQVNIHPKESIPATCGESQCI